MKLNLCFELVHIICFTVNIYTVYSSQQVLGADGLIYSLLLF